MKHLFLIYSITFLALVFIQTAHMLNSTSKLGQNFYLQTHLNKSKKSFFRDRINLNQGRNMPTNKEDLLRTIDLAKDMARKEKKLRLEEIELEEKRDKVFRQHLASRVQSSFINDFHTRRF